MSTKKDRQKPNELSDIVDEGGSEKYKPSRKFVERLLREYWDGKIEGCYRTKDLLDYAFGDTDKKTSAKIDAHLKECKVCYSEAEEYRTNRRILEDAVRAAIASGDTKLPQEIRHRLLEGMLRGAKRLRDELVVELIKDYQNQENKQQYSTQAEAPKPSTNKYEPKK